MNPGLDREKLDAGLGPPTELFFSSSAATINLLCICSVCTLECDLQSVVCICNIKTPGAVILE